MDGAALACEDNKWAALMASSAEALHEALVGGGSSPGKLSVVDKELDRRSAQR
jgi:hypothetical protein